MTYCAACRRPAVTCSFCASCWAALPVDLKRWLTSTVRPAWRRMTRAHRAARVAAVAYLKEHG